MKEIWRDVRDYEGLYEASSLGNIRSRNYRKTGRVQNLKPILNSYGYRQVSLCRDGKRRVFKVSVLVAETFYRRREKGEVVMHLNAIKTDDRAENLKIGTQSENMKQWYADGYVTTEKQRRAVSEANRGENNFSNKLSEAQIYEIRENPDELNGMELAEKYGVSAANISLIRRGVTWKYLDTP